METNVQPWTPSYRSAKLNFGELTKTVGKSPNTYMITTLLIHTLKPLKIRDSELIICQQGLQTLVCLSKHLPDHQQGRAFSWSVYVQKQKTLVPNTKNVKRSDFIQEIKLRSLILVFNHQWNMSVGQHKCFILKTTFYQTLGFLICEHWEQYTPE